MKQKILFIPLITFMLLTTLGCPRPAGEDCQKDYLFTVPVSFYPSLDTFKIGDTTWIAINIPATRIDSFSQAEKDLSDFPFKIDVAFVRFDSSNFYFETKKGFSFVLK